MSRSITALLVAGMAIQVAGCGDSCESVQSEIEEIGSEIQKDPGSAMERSEDLEDLRDKLREMGCLR